MTPIPEAIHHRLSIRRMLVTLSSSKKRPLTCPVCAKPVRLADHNELRLPCPTCHADLMIRFRHDWLYVPICFAGGLIAAYLQGLHNPLFLMCALMYCGVLVVIAAPLLAPLFPPKLVLTRDYIQTLGMPNK